MTDLDKTLAQRGRRYGEFAGHARVTQAFKGLLHAHPTWAQLADDQKEALEMVAHKIGRILNGDPNYDDSWIDIAGYIKLVADRLTLENSATTEAKPANPIAAAQAYRDEIVQDTKQKIRDMEQEVRDGMSKLQNREAPKSLRDVMDQIFSSAGPQATREVDNCDCPGCTLRRLVTGGLKGAAMPSEEGLSIEEIQALYPDAKIVIVTRSNDTKH